MIRHGSFDSVHLNSTLLDKLGAYWKFQDVSCWDSKRVVDGSTSGAVVYTSGKINKSFGFYGNGIRVDIPDNNMWTYTADACSFSFFAWVLLSVEQPGSYSQVFGSNGGNQWSFQLNKTTHPSYSLLFYDGAITTSSALTWDMSTWYHVGVIKDNRNLAMYRNGIKINDASISGSGNPTGMTFADDNSNEPLRGQLDEAGYWNKALSGNEVTELNNSGKGKSFPF